MCGGLNQERELSAQIGFTENMYILKNILVLSSTISSFEHVAESGTTDEKFKNEKGMLLP